MRKLTKLKSLRLENKNALSDKDNLKHFSQLEELTLSYIDALENVDSINSLTNLRILRINDCIKFNSLNRLALPNLRELVIYRCESLIEIVEIDGLLEKLEKLEVGGCANLQQIQNLKTLPSLTKIHFNFCPRLESGDTLAENIDLKEINILECPSWNPDQ